jgi:hypothetical protein
MRVTRKGYYKIVDPDGNLLRRPDGRILQVTSRDECYEWITESKIDGDFTIYCPDRRVRVVGSNAGNSEDTGTTPPVDQPPTIISTPAPPSFTEGVSGSYDMTQHVSDDGLSSVSYALSNTLPNGLSFNTSSGLLSYDGVGIASTSSHQLSATDSVGSAQSNAFNIVITGITQSHPYDGISVTPSAAGVAYAQAVPDDMAMLVIGMSNTLGITNALQGSAQAANIAIINGAQSGQSAAEWVDPNATPWSIAQSAVTGAGFTTDDVRVVWLLIANRRVDSPDLPTYITDLKSDMTTIIGHIRTKYPSAGLILVSGMHHTEFADPTSLLPGPYTEATNSIVDDVVNENADADWGPYIWNDGSTPRADGFVLTSGLFNPDNVHLTSPGYGYVADQITDNWFTGVSPNAIGDALWKSQSQLFTAPPLYSTFVTNFTSMAETTAEAMANGPADITTHEDYGENGDLTVFYSQYVNQRAIEEWSVRTGNPVTLNQAGVEIALRVQLERWGSSSVPAGAWHRAANVPYKALLDGDTTQGVPVTEAAFTEHLYGTSGATNFNRSYLSEYSAGSDDGVGNPRNDIRHTEWSRPCGYLGKAAIFYEKLGLVLDNPAVYRARSVDPLDPPETTLEWCYIGAINHVYRWMTEFTSKDSVEGPEPMADTTAIFMTALTVDFIYSAYKHFEARGEDPNQYFPSVVMHGDYKDDSQYPPFILNPYANTRDMLGAFMEFLWGAIDATPTLDTTPYDPDNAYTGGYVRINETHTIASGINAGTYFTGDPMVFRNGSGYINTYHRSASVGTTQGFNTNIQLMNPLQLVQVADLYDGIDIDRRDKYIRWADEVFAGGIDWGIPTRQKSKNQQFVYTFDYLTLRNSLWGRND